MARFLKKRHHEVGLPPGSLIFIGKQRTENPRIRVIEYDNDSLQDEFLDDMQALLELTPHFQNFWINIDGLHERELIAAVGKQFGVSSLVLEDIVNTGQRPKLDEPPEGIFITFKMLFLDEEETSIHAEQMSAVLTESCLLTFQEKPGKVFEPVRNRIRTRSGKIRKLGKDYLLYTLLDCVFEHYLNVIETMGERIEEIDNEVLDNPTAELLEEINAYRREIAYVRKAVRPAREIVLKLAKLENELINDYMQPYLQDLVDMAEQAYDSVEIYREMLNYHLGNYNMAVTNKLNEVMKFLTIFATIFIPLSFLAGVYGMNFEFMPELHFKYGYYALLGVMASVVLVMLSYFRKKKWL